MTAIMKVVSLVTMILFSSIAVADESHYDVHPSAPTAGGGTAPNSNPGSVPYSNGPTTPPIGQNCHTERVCVSVSCTAYDNQGKCTKQECVAWENKYVCK